MREPELKSGCKTEVEKMDNCMTGDLIEVKWCMKCNLNIIFYIMPQIS